MAAEIGKILLPADRIAARVRQLGRRLAPPSGWAGRDPVLVPVMKGCVLLAADLVRAWPGPLDVEFVSAKSYTGTQPGAVRLRVPRGLRSRVAGRPVLVVDDIYDTGATLAHVCRALEALGPAEVRTLVLFRKRRAPARPAIRLGGRSARRPPGRPDPARRRSARLGGLRHSRPFRRGVRPGLLRPIPQPSVPGGPASGVTVFSRSVFAFVGAALCGRPAVVMAQETRCVLERLPQRPGGHIGPPLRTSTTARIRAHILCVGAAEFLFSRRAACR